jgi:hypothetical protein
MTELGPVLLKGVGKVDPNIYLREPETAGRYEGSRDLLKVSDGIEGSRIICIARAKVAKDDSLGRGGQTPENSRHRGDTGYTSMSGLFVIERPSITAADDATADYQRGCPVQEQRTNYTSCLQRTVCKISL